MAARPKRESISNLDIDAIILPEIDEVELESDEEEIEVSPTKNKIEKWDWNADYIPLSGPIIPSLPYNFNPSPKHLTTEKEEHDKQSKRPIPLKYTTQVQYPLRLFN